MSSNHIAEMAKKQLEMSKAILNAEESDDDTDDLLLLSEPIFSQDSSSATAAAPSETPEASPTTPPKIVSTTTTATPTTTFTKQDDEKINAQGKEHTCSLYYTYRNRESNESFQRFPICLRSRARPLYYTECK
jgi:hypothetical protein